MQVQMAEKAFFTYNSPENHNLKVHNRVFVHYLIQKREMY